MDQIPQAKPEIDAEMIEAASHALMNERMVMGESVFKFEEAFARYIGVKHAVSVSSGTDALIIALIAMDCRDKDVVTTPFSFIATANSIIHAGGKPIFHDVSERDYNIDPTTLNEALTDKTKAIMPVHIFGHPCDMGAINDLAEERGLMVIEDACQAHGATYRGRKVGSLGTVGCFSFYPTKNMTVGGDGGLITTDDSDLAALIAKYRDCGRVTRYLHDVVGFTSRLNNVNAAVGLIQLKRLDGWNDRRRQLAERYNKLLKNVNEIVLPPQGNDDVKPVHHLFAIRSGDRDDLSKTLNEKGISTAVHYPIPIHLQPAYIEKFGYSPGMFKMSERLSEEMLSLPLFPSMKIEQVDVVCEAITSHYSNKIGN